MVKERALLPATTDRSYTSPKPHSIPCVRFPQETNRIQWQSMRANLTELTKVLRPMSDERARELVRQVEVEAGDPPDGFIAAKLTKP